MASVFLRIRRRKKKNGTVKVSRKWLIKYRGADGREHTVYTHYETKAQARRAAAAMDKRQDDARAGVESGIDRSSPKTLRDLLVWWLDNHSSRSPSHPKDVKTLEKHLVGTRRAKPGRPVYKQAEISRVRLAELSTGMLNTWVDAKEKAGELAPQSLNHLRMFIFRAFAKAYSRDWWKGPNVAAGVEIRAVPERIPSFLMPEEVPQLLRWVPEQWRDFFAAAVYTGMRKGELAGLLKTEVDFRNLQIRVGHSYERDRTKGGDEKAIPLHPELVPYLEHAMALSAGPLVFSIPTVEGGAVTQDHKLSRILRAALRRAGIVTGYRHFCNRKGCGYQAVHPDDELRRCPGPLGCGRKLVTVGIPKHLRFHDLRHTTASLLLMAGAPLAFVQELLRHADPAVTKRVYGHLASEWKGAEIQRLSFTGPKLLAVPKNEPDLVSRAAAKSGTTDSAPSAGPEKPKR